MNLNNATILVTGGAGFIGSHVVDALLKKGARVVIVDDLSTGHKENLNPAAVFYQANIADKETMADLFKKEKPEIVYHFAFNVQVPKSVQNPLMDMDSIIGSVNLLILSKDYRVKKFIFSSSGFVYGNTMNLPAKETEPFQPVSPYAIAKYSIEEYLKFFKKTYGLPFVAFRNAAIYGPRQTMGAMADYIRKLKEGKQSEIWGDGTKTRDYVYVADVVEANLLALDLSDEYPDPIFNIGTARETTLNELYEKLAAILGKDIKPMYHPDRPGEQMRYCLDNQKVKAAIGWGPRHNLDEGLKQMLS
jgi:UDP-glucose 4-epimerase